MSFIRISFNEGKSAIFVPDKFFHIFQKLLDTLKRDFDIARVTEMQSLEITDAEGTTWLPLEFFTVIVAEKIRDRRKGR